MSPLIGFQGQYPGGPIRRKPTGGRDFLQPREFKFIGNDIGGYIDNYLSQLNVPELPLTPWWVKSKIVADLERELFKAQANPTSDFSTTQMEEFGGEEAEAGMQGAFGIDVTLDPRKWASDPTGTARKTIEGWWRAASDPQDIEQRYYTSLWESITGNVNGGAATGTSGTGAIAAWDRLVERTRQIAEETLQQKPVVRASKALGLEIDKLRDPSVTGGDPNPLHLTNLGITRETEEKAAIQQAITTGRVITQAPITTAKVTEDVYDEYRKELIAWKRVSGGFASRDPQYDAVMQKGLVAISADFDFQINQNYGGNIDAFLKDHLDPKILSGPGGLDTYNDIRDGIQSFQSRVKLVEAIGDAETVGTKKVSTALTRYMQEGGGAIDATTLKAKNIEAIETGFNNYRKEIDNVMTQIKDIRGSRLLKGDDLDKFNGLMEGYEKTLAELDSMDINGLVYKLNTSNRVAAEAATADFMGRFNSIRNGGLTGRGITRGDVIHSSVQRSLMQNMFEDDLLMGSVQSGAGISKIGRAINSLDQGATFRMKRVMLTGVDVSIDRIDNLAEEILVNFEKGNLNQYLWSRARRRIEGYTPAFYSSAFMKKCHYFGLAVDVSSAPVSGYKWANKLFRNRFTEHRFDLELKGITGGDLFLRGVQGGSHLKAAGQLYSSWVGSKNINDEALVLMLNYDKFGGRGFKSLADAMRDHDFANELFRRNGNKQVILPVTKDKIQDFSDDFQKFKNWMSATFAKEGRAEKASGQLEMVRQLGKYNANFDTYKIALSHLGLIQKLAVKLNMLQTMVIKKVGKILAPISYIKIAVSEAIASALYATFVGATGGLGAAAYPVRVLFQLIARKITDLASAFASGILKFDLSGFKKQIDNFVSAANKAISTIFLTACGCCLGPLMLVSLIITGVFVGATPPTSPARTDIISYAPAPMATTAQPSLSTIGTCPISGGQNSCTSYPVCHGNDAYWSNQGLVCTYTIPYLAKPVGGGCPDTGSASCGPSTVLSGQTRCTGATPLQPYYGYAQDIRGGDGTVYLPKLGTVETWHVNSTFSIFKGSRGYGAILSATDTTPSPPDNTVKTYKVYMGHMDQFWLQAGDSGEPGDGIAQLFTGGGWRPHVHMELMINGIPSRPEDTFSCT
ncbi:hypothetical protein A3A69_01015 [candidate division WWE3 bacterium RIFCSPLOWO2_01_FULL_37_15]|uniref:Uncharacterized protein n=1 Tax=candidate division WWE3 bacterium RIFCSPLOWO2_01_FULL_37_15 TaxID=1802622 RepID=A0A1F4UZ20_UNCKA|nr:MAG: hypothetical protein A3A69_01015 [candidate division WWE3 bacterium RIFCSPLOWO2_01_FULL_37_15]